MTMIEEHALTRDDLYTWRKKAYERFIALGMPKQKQEAYQYIPLSKLSIPVDAATFKKSSFTPSLVEEQILPECVNSYLVFEDGFFLPEMSRVPKEIVVLPLDVALQTYGLFLHNRWTKSFKEELDPFCMLNAALHGRGAFVYVPPHVKSQAPLQIIHLLTNNSLAASRLQITLGKQASLSIVQTLSSSGFCNNAIDLSLDANSFVRFLDAQLLPTDSRSLLSLRATLKRDAHLEAFHMTNGSEVVRCSANIELSEENSSLLLQGIAMLSDERQAHFSSLVDHAAICTHSRQHVKMALNESSRSSFEGKILVRPIAEKTQAYQLNNNLLLSDAAMAYSKPNLEIFASDVKASHGATFTQLSDEELFYLRSRGILRSGAQALLTEGFCRELIDAVEIKSLRSALVDAMNRVLHENTKRSLLHAGSS